MSYEEIKKRIDESIKKEEARRRILKKKREEKQAIKKAGGGHAIARRIMPNQGTPDNDTDFKFGYNEERGSNRGSEVSVEGCMGRVVCKTCNKFHGYCRETEERIKMLPTGDGSSSTNRTRTGGLNFINTVDLSTSAKEAKILMVKYNEKSGKSRQPAVTIKMAFEGEMRYLWLPCRKEDPRYAALLNAFGPDENNWIDKRILLYLEKDEFTESYQTKIDIPQAKGAKK